MNLEEIKKLDFVGTHTHRHLPLATLPKKEIRKEIKKSLDYFKDIKINSISYPYGGEKAVNKSVIEVVKEFKFKFGLTMFRGVNNNFKNRFLLNRIDTNDIKVFV
jgi:peptidoglycan/xylan/chitin deacetylase (PgdA/CDA1 family)